MIYLYKKLIQFHVDIALYL